MLKLLKPRRVLSIALDWTRPKDPPLSLGQASIVANLLQRGVDVVAKSWAVNQPDFDYSSVLEHVMSRATDGTDLALGCFVWHEDVTQRLLTDLKKEHFPGRIILGGPQISYTKRNLEAFYPQADVFIRGYGEVPLAELLLSPEPRPTISGVHYAGTKDTGESAHVDLTSLPSPFLSGLIPPQPFLRWETQRGCPFRCSFCQHRESDVSKTRRPFLRDRILREVDWIVSNPVISDVAVLDPTFNVKSSMYMEVIQAFSDGGYRGKLALQCRAEMITPDFLDAIERLNQTGRVVLELGLQTTHKEEMRVIDRANSLTKVARIFHDLKRRNIESEVSLIYGLPNQTVDSFQQSVDFCQELEIPTIHAFPLMLLRGTPLYERKAELGLVESSDVHIDTPRVTRNIPHVISSPSFTVDDWHKMAAIAATLDTSGSGKMLNTLQHTLWKNNKPRTET